MAIPITLRGKDSSGRAFSENTSTIVVSKHGANIATTHQLKLGDKLTMENYAGERVARARVVWLGGKCTATDLYEVGIELIKEQDVRGTELAAPDDRDSQPAAWNAPKRFKALTPVSVGFVGANVRFTGKLVDISLSGTLIRCSKNVEPGTMGRLGFEVGDEMFRVVAVVRRRVAGVGIAFSFQQMSQSDRQVLRRLLFRLSRQSSC